MTRPLSIAHLTLLELPPARLIQVAGEAGFSSVGLRLIAVTDTTAGYDLMNNPQMMRETLSAMRETGVTVNDIEFVRLMPEFDPNKFDRFLAAGAELGARHIVTAPYDPELNRLTDNLASFADRGSRFGLTPVLEFFPWTNVPDLQSARTIVENTGDASIGVLLDTLHFNRSSGNLEEIAKTDPSRFPFVHLCDANVQPNYSEAELLHTARGARLIPGDGDIPLLNILDHLPQNIPIALEIPLKNRRGLGPAELAEQMFRKTQRFLSSGEKADENH